MVVEDLFDDFFILHDVLFESRTRVPQNVSGMGFAGIPELVRI